RGAEDDRADLDALGHGGEGADERPGLVQSLDVAVVVRTLEQVVVHPDRVQALLLGRERECAGRRPGGDHAAAVPLVRRNDHADLHAGGVSGTSANVSAYTS